MSTITANKTITFANEGGNYLGAVENKEFYERGLLEALRSPRFIASMGKQVRVPKNRGNIMTWRKRLPIEHPTTALTEGVTPTPNSFKIAEYRMSLSQYGDYIEYTDLTDLYSIDDIAKEASEELGISGAELIEDLVFTELYKVPNVVDNSTATLKASDLIKFKAIFTKNNVKPINGKYVLIISPEQGVDLKTSTDANSWIEVNKYTSNETILDGEVGTLYGFKVIESNRVKTEGGVSHAIALGAEAFAIPMLEGDSAATPQLIVKGLGSAGTADPLDQKATVGYKINGFGVRINYDEAVMVVKTKATALDAPAFDEDDRTHYVQTAPAL